MLAGGAAGGAGNSRSAQPVALELVDELGLVAVHRRTLLPVYGRFVPLRRYVSPEEDSARWEGFPFRAGDIVVSTRSKHGTTWLQTILLLLIHQEPDLPAPLAMLSPWLDHLAEPREAVVSRLEAQRHRRVIKTHTPLDGVPRHPDVSYVVAARHPLDAAVSLYHQGDNIDRERLQRLTGVPAPAASAARRPIGDWLRDWIDEEAVPTDDLDSLPGVMWHLADAWAHRHAPNIVLVHYADLLADLAAQMRRLAGLLGIDVDQARAPALVEAATFDRMRARSEQLAPDALGILRDPAAFFRRGASGGAADVLDVAALGRYDDRARALAPPELLAWLHRP